MRGFLNTVHRQMRIVTFNFVVYLNNSAGFLIAAIGLYLWMGVSSARSSGGGSRATCGSSRCAVDHVEVAGLFRTLALSGGKAMLEKPVAVTDAEAAR